ncbi:hypothetical protein EG68_09854 [Paragonimus skrjabini miyazakii]|uniref:PDZ domain-containing protein n=1 Tax=Paragonimus skrjabini miyazakii TaxID=59628 RepID=A0A8S9Y9I4_9TREM|nr:hypothetical protein EG68_09854 [Paragonimus skrjabini miyazakii]
MHVPRARLCEICKWEDFTGYGFSLNGIQGKFGQFIGEVDPASPAYAAGVRENDVLIEVNGVNVLSESHTAVVSRIKSNPDRVCLLVVDPESKKYFEKHCIVIDSYMEGLQKFCCPQSRHGKADEHNDINDVNGAEIRQRVRNLCSVQADESVLNAHSQVVDEMLSRKTTGGTHISQTESGKHSVSQPVVADGEEPQKQHTVVVHVTSADENEPKVDNDDGHKTDDIDRIKEQDTNSDEQLSRDESVEETIHKSSIRYRCCADEERTLTQAEQLEGQADKEYTNDEVNLAEKLTLNSENSLDQSAATADQLKESQMNNVPSVCDGDQTEVPTEGCMQSTMQQPLECTDEVCIAETQMNDDLDIDLNACKNKCRRSRNKHMPAHASFVERKILFDRL